MDKETFTKSFTLLFKESYNKLPNIGTITKAYAAYRFLGVEINKIPKEWYA